MLLNEVVRTSGTNGYSTPLTLEDGRKLAAGIEIAIERDEAAQLLCRDADGKLVGIGSLRRYKQPDRRHVLEVSSVAILPDRRGQFLTDGWRQVLRRSQEMGAALLAIDVSEDGPIRLWERLGFKTWGVMKDYARVGERKLDGYYMTADVAEALARVGKPNGAVH